MRVARVFFLLGSAGLAFAQAGTAAPRVAIQVSAGAQSAEWQAVLTAGLGAARPATELVERSELARVWTERERAVLTTRSEASAPTVVAVERYLHFRSIGGGRWIVELIDAVSGRALGASAVEKVEPGAGAGLVKAAAGLLDAPVPAAKARAVTVAVVESAGGSGDEQLFGLAVRLRAALADSGLVVLDRALTQEVAVERNEAKRGFRVAAAEGRLLGADYWMELSASELRVVRLADGVVAAVRAREAKDDVDALQRWIFPLLAGHEAQPKPYLPEVEVEALVPFYRGVALYNDGRFEEATEEFSRAYQLNDRFHEAYEWEARCYEALGMEPLAAAVRRFMALGLLENLNSVSGRLSEGEGLAFLGVNPADGDEPAAGRLLSTLAASALATRTDLRLHMPEQLGQWVREYDWMSGGGGSRGWEQAPDLFRRMALSGRVERTADGLRIHWVKRDVMSGRVRAERDLALGQESAAWPEKVREFLADWPRMGASEEAAAGVKRAAAGPVLAGEVQRLASAVANATGREGNVARLKLAQVAPEHPLVAGRVFVKGQGKEQDGIDGFLELAMQEWLIPRIAEGDETRRWLELARLHTYLDYSGEGKRYSGKPIDALEGLRRFIAYSGEDLPGLVARYSWLFEQQAVMPPAELAAACAALQVDLGRLPAGKMPDGERLRKALDGLRWAAAGAAGGPDEVRETSAWIPVRLRVMWSEAGRVTLKYKPANFRLWYAQQLPAEKKAEELKALLFLNAQGRISGKFDGAWLEKFPRSVVMADYIAQEFWQRGRHENMPAPHPFNWKARMELQRVQIDYFMDTVESYLSQVKAAEELKPVYWVITVFCTALTDLDFQELVSDADYARLHQRLVKAYDGTAARFSYVASNNNRALPWQRITREAGRADTRDQLRPGYWWIMDKGVIVREIDALETTPAVVPADAAANGMSPLAWWTRLRRWEFDNRLTATEHAAYYLRHTADVLRWYESREPSANELPLLFEHGLMLFYGRRDAEAEQIFRRVLAVRPGSMNTVTQEEYQANAAFRLAQLWRQAGRIPEAMEMAGRGLALDMKSGPHRLVSQRYDYMWNDYDLTASLLRLLREMRNDPAKAVLPARVGVVSVPTPNGDNPMLHVFYRTPPKTAAKGPRRVLIMAPVHNTDALDNVRDDSEWARFADEQGWVLVVPQFYVSDHSFRIDNRFSHVRYANVWSGEALLRAMDEIGRTVPLEKKRLLLHGVASGSGFACHFAAWRPELVSAVSVNNGNFGMPRFRTTGLQPMGAQKNVKYFITASETDGVDNGGYPRYEIAVDFVTRMRGAGVSVEWRSWADAPHVPTVEMEEAARAFLKREGSQ